MSLVPRPGAFVLLHNPQCPKSRQLKVALDERAIEYEERRYLDDPLSRRELDTLSRLVGGDIHDLVRSKDDAYEAAGLTPQSSSRTLLDAIAKHPRLLERPILLTRDRAAIGRPTEAALALIE